MKCWTARIVSLHSRQETGFGLPSPCSVKFSNPEYGKSLRDQDRSEYHRRRTFAHVIPEKIRRYKIKKNPGARWWQTGNPDGGKTRHSPANGRRTENYGYRNPENRYHGICRLYQ